MNMHYGQPVVITGIGLICSLGENRVDVWSHLLQGAPNMGPVTLFDATRHRIDDCVVAELPPGVLESRVEEIKARGFVPPRKGRFRWMVLSAAIEAFDDAALDLGSPQDRAEGMVILGTMTAGSEEAERIAIMTELGKKPRVSDNIGKRPGIAMQDVTRAFDLSGPTFGLEAACASGASAVTLATRLIGSGSTPWCLAGGAEASIIASSVKMAHALSIIPKSFSNDPNAASRPFDKRREGYVPAEGACLLVLESEEHALARGARPYARIKGVVDRSCNEHPTRMSTPFCRMVMEQVLENSKVRVDELGWINAHATSTVHGDIREAQAIGELVGETGVRVSAPKSMTGHLLGGSGAAEAAFSAMSLRDQQIPPTVNLEDQDPECPIDCITSRTAADFRYVLSNSWGFGGTGSCIVLERM